MSILTDRFGDCKEFEVKLGLGNAKLGDRLTLKDDDNTDSPIFYNPRLGYIQCLGLHRIKPYETPASSFLLKEQAVLNSKYEDYLSLVASVKSFSPEAAEKLLDLPSDKRICFTFTGNLATCCKWDWTKEGHDYWFNINQRLKESRKPQWVSKLWQNKKNLELLVWEYHEGKFLVVRSTFMSNIGPTPSCDLNNYQLYQGDFVITNHPHPE